MIEYGREAIDRLGVPLPVEHRFLGERPRRTAAAVAFLFAILVLSGVRRVMIAVDFQRAGVPALAPVADGVADVLILAVAVTVTILPIVYAAWNGGPALSFAMPLAPVLLGDLLARSYVLDLDLAVAVSTGAIAAAVAVYGAGVRRTGSLRPWRVGVDENALWLVTGTTALALVVAARFVPAIPEHVREWYAPFGLALAVPVAVVLAYWFGAGRRAIRSR